MRRAKVDLVVFFFYIARYENTIKKTDFCATLKIFAYVYDENCVCHPSRVRRLDISTILRSFCSNRHIISLRFRRFVCERDAHDDDISIIVQTIIFFYCFFFFNFSFVSGERGVQKSARKKFGSKYSFTPSTFDRRPCRS